MQNYYYRKNRRKYNLKVHLVLVTKYRKQLLCGNLGNYLKQLCLSVAERNKWNIIAMESDKDHIHILMEYDTTECVSNIAGTLKRQTTYFLWERYSAQLSQQYWKKHIFWSDGYFACSIGEASADTIQRYIESQG